MKILIFNRSFYPDVEATGQFLTELCEDLTLYGHSVTVICGKPYHSDNKKYNLKKMNIVRVWGTTLPKHILIFRLINLGIYFLFSFFAGFLISEKPDLIIAQTDPPLSCLLGLFFSKWYRVKFIYSVKDMHPEVGIITGKLKNPILNFILEKSNMISYKKADMIISIGLDMKQKICEKGVNPKKIEVINDWADISEITPIETDKNSFLEKNNLKDKFIVMYSGNIGLTQGLERIIDLANHFKKNNILRFVLIGEGASKLKLQEKAKELNLENIIFLSYQQKNELKYSLSAANIHLITMEKGLSGVMVPSKIYGILACGRPFLGLVDQDSEVSTIANDYKCGFIIDPNDTEKIVSTTEWALSHKQELENMGKNSRKAAVEKYNRKISTSKFNEIISKI
jgi:glycosyltransferase involved in cell wall biosynthesis